MNIIKQGNKTMYYLDEILLLTITELGNNRFVTENHSNRIEGICYKFDEYTTLTTIEKHQTLGKNGRFYNSKKLLDANTRWFSYILQEYGFVEKTKCTN